VWQEARHLTDDADQDHDDERAGEQVGREGEDQLAADRASAVSPDARSSWRKLVINGPIW
jgi:hypothetical protein